MTIAELLTHKDFSNLDNGTRVMTTQGIGTILRNWKLKTRTAYGVLLDSTGERKIVGDHMITAVIVSE